MVRCRSLLFSRVIVLCKILILKISASVYRIQRCHVVAHGRELHGHSHEIELVEALCIGLKSLFGARLYMFVTQHIIGARGTLRHDVLCFSASILIESEHILHDMIIHRIVATRIAQQFVKLWISIIAHPVFVPHVCDSHADKHHPSQRNGRIGSKLPDAIREISLYQLFQSSFYIRTLRQTLIHHFHSQQITVQVIVQPLFKSFFHILSISIHTLADNGYIAWRQYLVHT